MAVRSTGQPVVESYGSTGGKAVHGTFRVCVAASVQHGVFRED